MDQEINRKSGSSGSLGNAALLLATLFAGAILVRQLPLNDSRPSMDDARWSVKIDARRIDARLWQDPVGTVAKSINDAHTAESANGGVHRSGSEALAGTPAKLDIAAFGHDAVPPVIVGVMVPGGSYPGDAEWRRKARYAVLSGFQQMGFVPSDAEHLEYFRLQDRCRPASVRRTSDETVVPYEWLDRGVIARGSTDARHAADASPIQGSQHAAIVLWLDQAIFAEQTVARLTSLFQCVVATGNTPKGQAVSAGHAKDVPRVIILGPGDSNTLRSMNEELVKPASLPDPSIDLMFYDSGATAPDADLLPIPEHGETPMSVHNFFGDRHLTLFRTIGDDAALACKLRDELSLRGIGPPSQDSGEIVLISESDTVYARSLSYTVGHTLLSGAPCVATATNAGVAANTERASWAEHGLYSFTYLRGLDGHTPVRDGTPAGTGTGSNASKAPAANSTSDDKRIERAEGEGQFDYLRRLATRLRAIDRTAHAAQRHGIRAVGVLGSDVYDKLIVLQALRAAFPDVLFFTTDLDARLLHPSERDWTRNLLVASSFGLELSPQLQSSTLPFRDSYQTSLYLATLVALTNAKDRRCSARQPDATTACPVNQDKIDEWRRHPRLFEIGRNGPFDLSGYSAGESLDASAAAWRASDVCKGIADLRDCRQVHPKPHALVPQPSPFASRLSFAVVVLSVLGLLLTRGAGERVRNWAAGKSRGNELQAAATMKTRLVAILVIGAVLIGATAYLLPGTLQTLARFLTQDGRGVPMTLLDGVSIWPTEIIRTFALILTCGLTYRDGAASMRTSTACPGKCVGNRNARC